MINLFTVLPYILYVKTNGYYIFHEDKSPVSIWEYFIHRNFSYDMTLALLFLLLVEINYVYLFAKVRWYLFACSCLLIGIIPFALLLIHKENIRMSGSLLEVKPTLLMAAYAFTYALIRDYFYHLKHKKTLQLQQVQSELNMLKSQLNPHFLFNSLNYLYGTALKEGAALTAGGIDQISDLLRYTIAGMHADFVPLEEEIHFIENYLALQKARLPEKENIVVGLQISAAEKDWKIAPLLLLTFIENAFKYGISMDGASNVNINLTVYNGRLTLKADNTIIKGHHEIKGNNTGIKSALKRLKLLYPDKYTFESSTDGTVYSISLQLLLHK